MTIKALSRHGLLGPSAILMTIKLMAALLAFIFHFLLARQLSIQEYGLFSLALTCLVFSGAFAKQGVEPAIVRYFAQKDRTDIHSLYIYVLLFIVTNIVVVGLVLLFSADFVFDTLLNTVELSELLPLIIGLTALQTCLAVNSSALKGRHFPVSSMLFTGFLSHLFAVAFLYFQPVSSALEALNLLFYAVCGTVFLSFIVTKMKLMITFTAPEPIKRSGIIELYHTSRVLFVSSLASLISQQFAVLILARSVSLSEVGIYSVAIKVSMLMSYPLFVLNAITAPKYAALFSQGKMQGFRHLAWITTKSLIVIATLLFTGVAIFSKEIVSLFGEHYLAAAPILIILAAGQWFNLATGSVVSILVMTGYEKIHRRNSLFAAVMTIVTMFFCVPIYGIWAAAWLTAIIMALFNLVSLFFVSRLIYSRHAK
ncbi:MAG: O-antigen/teichoic acid export membrane protein [Colwellia sp.]|jgi:O-antigen/teichoic acid export membrane protein